MERLLFLFCLFVVSGTLSSCITNLNLSSSPPGAEVFVGDKKIGVTPLEIGSSDLTEESGGGYIMSLQYPGYDKVWLWIPFGFRNLTTNINLLPFRAGKNTEVLQFSRADADQKLEKMMMFQTELLVRKSSDVPEDLSTEFPLTAAGHYLQALNLLNRGDTASAKESLLKALLISPNDSTYVGVYRELGGDPVRDVEQAQKSVSQDANKG